MPRIISIFFALWAFAAPAFAAPGPMEHVKSHVERALFILTDPQFKSETSIKKQEDMLIQVGERLFDFNDVTRLAVGRYWRSFSPEERLQFRDLFAQLLQTIYMDKIRAYQGEPVVFDKEIMLSSTKARVNTHIVWNDKDVPLDYMLRFKNNEWRVYDVIVEGVSLIKNYRSQFSSILSKNPPSVLLEQVRKKIQQPADNS